MNSAWTCPGVVADDMVGDPSSRRPGPRSTMLGQREHEAPHASQLFSAPATAIRPAPSRGRVATPATLLDLQVCECQGCRRPYTDERRYPAIAETDMILGHDTLPALAAAAALVNTEGRATEHLPDVAALHDLVRTWD